MVLDDKLVPATDETLREVAHSAMLLSQGAERAIEMRRQEREDAEGDDGQQLPPAA